MGKKASGRTGGRADGKVGGEPSGWASKRAGGHTRATAHSSPIDMDGKIFRHLAVHSLGAEVNNV